MKKGIVALALIFGFYFVHAQDDNLNTPDRQMDQNSEFRDYNFDADEVNKDTDLKESDKKVVTAPEESTETGKTKIKEKIKDKNGNSVIGNVVAAPFKLVGTTVGEVGRGVGHIVAAPFKGVAKMFEGDSKEKKKTKVEYSEQASNKSGEDIQNEETFEVEAKGKTEDGKYKYNSSYDSEESNNSTDTDYMYIR